MDKQPISKGQIWSAVGSMALCVAMLIASEFMPVSLLTPIAHDLACDRRHGGPGDLDLRVVRSRSRVCSSQPSPAGSTGGMC